MRGWPRILCEVWRIDQDGRHNVYGYGTMCLPMSSGDYNLSIPCWRPMGNWWERLIGVGQ